jgi:hypothetical protein
MESSVGKKFYHFGTIQIKQKRERSQCFWNSKPSKTAGDRGGFPFDAGADPKSLSWPTVMLGVGGRQESDQN